MEKQLEACPVCGQYLQRRSMKRHNLRYHPNPHTWRPPPPKAILARREKLTAINPPATV